MEIEDFEYLKDVIDNVRYWDTCPDDYKQRLGLLTKQLDDHINQVKNNGVLDDVSNRRELLESFIDYADSVTLRPIGFSRNYIDDFLKGL